MSAWTCRHTDGKVVQKIVPPRPRIPYWKGLGADSEEKHEPASDIDTALMDSLKVLDPEGPIREEAALGKLRQRPRKSKKEDREGAWHDCATDTAHSRRRGDRINCCGA